MHEQFERVTGLATLMATEAIDFVIDTGRTISVTTEGTTKSNPARAKRDILSSEFLEYVSDWRMWDVMKLLSLCSHPREATHSFFR